VYPTSTEPAWSPDGAKIACSGTDGDIWVIRPDGTGLVNVTNTPTPRHEYRPDWSPDGSKLAFTSWQAQAEIHVANADGTSRSFVTTGAWPAWSPDGARIAFVDVLSIFTVNVDGSERSFLHDGVMPDWQPLRPAPQRGDYKNAPAFCRAERDFLGEREFAQRYGKNGTGANAFGQCVSRSN
jgi:Tol biopolymer transport system component